MSIDYRTVTEDDIIPYRLTCAPKVVRTELLTTLDGNETIWNLNGSSFSGILYAYNRIYHKTSPWGLDPGDKQYKNISEAGETKANYSILLSQNPMLSKLLAKHGNYLGFPITSKKTVLTHLKFERLAPEWKDTTNIDSERLITIKEISMKYADTRMIGQNPNISWIFGTYRDMRSTMHEHATEILSMLKELLNYTNKCEKYVRKYNIGIQADKLISLEVGVQTSVIHKLTLSPDSSFTDNIPVAKLTKIQLSKSTRGTNTDVIQIPIFEESIPDKKISRNVGSMTEKTLMSESSSETNPVVRPIMKSVEISTVTTIIVNTGCNTDDLPIQRSRSGNRSVRFIDESGAVIPSKNTATYEMPTFQVFIEDKTHNTTSVKYTVSIGNIDIYEIIANNIRAIIGLVVSSDYPPEDNTVNVVRQSMKILCGELYGHISYIDKFMIPVGSTLIYLKHTYPNKILTSKPIMVFKRTTTILVNLDMLNKLWQHPFYATNP